MISEQIEQSIKDLKKCRYSDDKRQQYNLIASRISRFLFNTKTEKFGRGLILSFFDDKTFKPRTQQRHIKNIIECLKYRGIITDDTLNKTTNQCRVYELKSDDKKSYMALMKSNGYTQLNYFKWYCDSDGIPRRRKVGVSRLNGLPVDKNGDSVEDWDISELKQTISRTKQGVRSFGSKSIALEKRTYSTKGFKVC